MSGVNAVDGEGDRVQRAGRRLPARAELRDGRDREPGVGLASQATCSDCHAVQACHPRHERLIDQPQVPARQLVDDLGVLAWAEGAGTVRGAGRLTGRLGHGDVGADAIQRVQHGALRVLDPVGSGRHHDDQADPHRQAHGDDRGLADPVPQLTPQVGQEEHA